jgi:hypothetical protein
MEEYQIKKPVLELIDFIDKSIEEKSKTNKIKLIIFILGLSSIFGWYFHIFQVFNALFHDKSLQLGFSENYGVIIISYNLFGEMVFELILFSSILIVNIILTLMYLIKRRV